MQLLISSGGGDAFRGEAESVITQVNSTDLNNLMPVSTADLKTFFCTQGTMGDYAAQFAKVEDEKYYYHGRVYIQAKAEGQPADTRMELYLDQSIDSGGELFQKATGDILNAGRLGLMFNQEHFVIFKLSDQSNAEENRKLNTMIDGQVLGGGQVLTMNGNNAQAVKDPAVSLQDYTMNVSENDSAMPKQSLFSMNLNQIYPVDIYFYVEGCDPDCYTSVQNTDVSLHLAFYGVLT